MLAAELFVHSFLIVLAVLGVCALTGTAIKKMWPQLLAKPRPRTRKVNQSMNKNTSPLRDREAIKARLDQVRSELGIFKQVNAPQSSIDLMTARARELEWVLQEAN